MGKLFGPFLVRGMILEASLTILKMISKPLGWSVNCSVGCFQYWPWLDNSCQRWLQLQVGSLLILPFVCAIIVQFACIKLETQRTWIKGMTMRRTIKTKMCSQVHSGLLGWSTVWAGCFQHQRVSDLQLRIHRVNDDFNIMAGFCWLVKKMFAEIADS